MKVEEWNKRYEANEERWHHQMTRPQLYKLVEGVRAYNVESCEEVLHIGMDRFVAMCVAFNKSIGEGRAVVCKARTVLRENGYEFDRETETWTKQK